MTLTFTTTIVAKDLIANEYNAQGFAKLHSAKVASQAWETSAPGKIKNWLISVQRLRATTEYTHRIDATAEGFCITTDLYTKGLIITQSKNQKP